MEAATNVTESVEQPEAKPAKTRTSITIRLTYLEQAKEVGTSVSAVIDKALGEYLAKGTTGG